MGKKNKVSLPGMGGGLFRPSEGEGTGIQFKPEHVIGVAAFIVVFEIMLHLYGAALY